MRIPSGVTDQLEQRFLGRDSSLQSLIYRRTFPFAFTNPFAQRFGDTIYCDISGGSCISGLLRPRSPAAIIGFIVTIVIDAINGFSCWSLSHICEKVKETIKPSLTYFNTASAIIVKRFRCWVQTSFTHHRIASIFRRFAAAVFQVGHTNSSGIFSTKTSTRGNVALDKSSSWGYFFPSTITSCKPYRFTISGWEFFNNNKTTKPFLKQFKASTHMEVNIP